MEKHHLHNITPFVGTEVLPNLSSSIIGSNICTSSLYGTYIDITSFGN